MSKLKTVTAVALLVGGVGGAVAAEVTYWRADLNKDGIVSQDERAQHNAELYGPMGREQALPAAPEPSPYAQSRAKGEFSYEQADLNRDGIVSQDEWDSYHAQIYSGTGTPPGYTGTAPQPAEAAPPMSEEALGRARGEFSYRDADLNRDGFVSSDEWDRYHQTHPMR
jgi:hypothetical protein